MYIETNRFDLYERGWARIHRVAQQPDSFLIGTYDMKKLVYLVLITLGTGIYTGPAVANADLLYEEYGLRFAYESNVQPFENEDYPEYAIGFFYVAEVKPGSYADEAGLKPSSVIYPDTHTMAPNASLGESDIDEYSAKLYEMLDSRQILKFSVYEFEPYYEHVEENGSRFMYPDVSYYFPVGRLEQHLGFEIDEDLVVTNVVAGSAADAAKLQLGDIIGSVSAGPHGANRDRVMEHIFVASTYLEGEDAILIVERGEDVVDLKFPLIKFSVENPAPVLSAEMLEGRPQNPFLSDEFRSRNFKYRAKSMLPMIFDGDIEALIENNRARFLSDEHMSSDIFSFLHGMAREIHEDDDLLAECYPNGHMRLPWTRHVEFKNMTYGYTTREYSTDFLEIFAPEMEAYYREFFEYWHQPVLNTAFNAGRVIVDEYGCGAETVRMLDQITAYANRILQDH